MKPYALDNMPVKYARKEHTLRTTLTINEELLEEAKTLSGAKTKKEAIVIALKVWERITKLQYRIKYRHLTRA